MIFKLIKFSWIEIVNTWIISKEKLLKKIKISFVPIEKLNKLSKNNHQGIVASISPVKTLDIQDLENSIEKRQQDF